MVGKRATLALLSGMIMLTPACSGDDSADGPETFVRTTTRDSGTSPAGTGGAPAVETDGRPTTATEPRNATTTTTTTTTSEARSTTTTISASATTIAAASTTTVTTTTTVISALPVFDPACVVEIADGESLSLIADRFDDDTVTVATIRTENGIVGDNIDPGDFLDVCVANGLNDITGEQRTETDVAAVATLTAVEAQQRRLNELFAGLGTPELLVDGISGPVTRQRLCAARLAFGLPVSTADMIAGSEEEQILMAATTLPIPFTTAVLSQRWILIDRTCQIMFAGEGADRLTFVFPTSTGQPGHETRDQDRSRAFRFNPALGNNGWHNSTIYPVADDNPLNGNMYKPIYFDRGQAIHGANNVPTTPQSKGCARLRVEHHEALIAWLGLGDVTNEIGDRDRINVTVNVQGT